MSGTSAAGATHPSRPKRHWCQPWAYTLPAVRKVRIPTRTAIRRPKSGMATGTMPEITLVSDVARLVKAVLIAVIMESMVYLPSINRRQTKPSCYRSQFLGCNRTAIVRNHTRNRYRMPAARHSCDTTGAPDQRSSPRDRQLPTVAPAQTPRPTAMIAEEEFGSKSRTADATPALTTSIASAFDWA